MKVDKEFSAAKEDLSKQLVAITKEANNSRLLSLSSITNDLNQLMSQTVP